MANCGKCLPNEHKSSQEIGAMTDSSTSSAERSDAIQHQPAELCEVQRLVAEAIRAHEAGLLEEARQLYLRVLAMDARNARSSYGLGLIAQQTGDFEAAVRMLRQAKTIDPNEVTYHLSLAGVLQAQRKLEESLAEYRRALALNPDYAGAHNNIAGVLQALGKFEEARMHYQRAVALKPDYAAAYCNLGVVLQNLGNLAESVSCHEKALLLRPELVEAHNNLGLVLRQQGKLEEAKAHYERAVILRPNYAEGYSNLGVLLRQLGKLEDSAACLEKALSLRPNSANAFDNLGNTLRDLGRLEESAACHERALALRPGSAKAHNNLGYTQRKQGKLEESRKSFNRALALEPESVDIRWNLCLLDLLEGNYAAGWSGYEVRNQRKENRPRSFPKPIWRGEPLNGARVLLHSEQGLGDSIQFLRYVPMVQAAGGSVILNVPSALRRLAKHLPGVDTVTVDEEPLPPFDWHCPLMSLPLAFKTTLDSLPRHVPYLTVPQEVLRAAENRQWSNQKLCVGLVWSGNPKCTEDQSRSMSLSCVQPLLDLDGLQFFSLQLGTAASQLGATQTPITDLQFAINDLADTAALMTRLDLIITVDTAVAHLAGALAKPTWVLVPFAPDWRWLTDREDSPWYPTLRLIRQPSSGDWDAVIARVRTELSVLVAARRLQYGSCLRARKSVAESQVGAEMILNGKGI
jgi:tetratricopeptide (TPR) repeat protein